MAVPSIRSSSSYAPGAATSSHVVSVPAGVANGDLLYAVFVLPSNGGVPVIGTPPTGWVQDFALQRVGAFGADFGMQGFTRTALSEPASYTFNASISDRPAASIFAVKDASAVTAGVQSGANLPGVVSGTTGTVTPAVANSLVVDIFGVFEGGAGAPVFTQDAAFTDFAQITNANNFSGIDIGSKVQGASSVSATVSWTGGGSSLASNILVYSPIVVAAAPQIAGPQMIVGPFA